MLINYSLWLYSNQKESDCYSAHGTKSATLWTQIGTKFNTCTQKFNGSALPRIRLNFVPRFVHKVD